MKPVEHEARQRLQAGRPDEAVEILRKQLAHTPRDAPLRELLAQVLASLSRKDEAIAELKVAVDQVPQARAARLLLARLANELGQSALAEEHARALTEANPKDSEAWSALGFAAFALGRRQAARDGLRKAVSLAPGYAAARYNLSSVLVALENSEEALVEAEEALRLGARKRGASLVKARALVQLDRLDEAEQVLGAVLGENPADAESHELVVQVRQLRGGSDPMRDLRSAARSPKSTPALRLALGNMLRRCGDLSAAAEEVRRLIAELGRAPQLLTSLAAVQQESGQLPEAFALSREAHAGLPGDVGIAENFVATAIATGNLAEALPVVEKFRAARPRDQRWITYRIDIARLRGEHGFEDWFDPGIVTRTMDLPTPAGYRDQEDFLAALREALGARHRQKNHPLDQSLRHGTQTSRNLLVKPEPVVAQLLASFDDALAEFQRGIGTSDAHPLTARNHSRAVPIGCWSVRLRRGGFHVNHIHPEGWLSSAYYVTVPDEAADENTRAGWLKFGEPRFAVAGLGPLSFVRPKPGRLVLFPSYLWHGTNALALDAPRMSVAFDALPHAEIM